LDLSIYAFVGIIMLVGLVKKNAIMMIDFAIEAERRDKKSPRDAILEACRVRFRPIMMTTMAALMGTLPIALGAGAGAESRRPLGVSVVGGRGALNCSLMPAHPGIPPSFRLTSLHSSHPDILTSSHPHILPSSHPHIPRS